MPMKYTASENKRGVMNLLQTFIIPLLVPVLIGIGTSSVLIGKMEERLVALEGRITQHEADYSRLREAKESDRERITRVESILPAMQRDVAEIKIDLQTLVRGAQ